MSAQISLYAKAQPELVKGDGPIVLVLAPTRELALQTKETSCKSLLSERTSLGERDVHFGKLENVSASKEECDRFGKSSKIKNTCCLSAMNFRRSETTRLVGSKNCLRHPQTV